MNIVNLTPHAISVINPENEITTYPPSGTVARVTTTQNLLGNINGVPLTQTIWGDVVGVPEPVEGTVYLVSALVLARCTDRADVVGPDTGPKAVRNEKGQITAVCGFVK